MSVNPATGIVTYTLAEWKEESQLWERDGAAQERERIIKLLEEHLGYGDAEWDSSVMAIIALIKGENKASHTHEIEVSGAPCDCEAKGWNVCVCDGIEPCEPEGENK